MANIEPEQLFDEIRHLLEREDAVSLRRRLRNTDAADLAEIVEMLGGEEQQMFMAALNAEEAGDVLSMVDEATRGEIVEDMSNLDLTGVVATMAPDDAADLLGELSDEQTEELLESLPPEQKAEVAPLLQYAEDTAGGLMTPVLVSVEEHETVAEAVSKLREKGLSDEEPFYVYVVDGEGRFRGLVPLRKLIMVAPETPVSTVMATDAATVHVDDDQESVVNVIRRHDLPAVAVLDGDDRLVGRITHDDVADVIVEEADEDMFRMAGTDAAELERASPLRAARVRMTWLLPCLVGAMFSGVVMAVFQAAIDPGEFLVLVLFVPMIAAMGGNSGVQSATVIIRGLATQEMAGQRLMLAIRREMPIAGAIGIACGLVAGAVAGIVVGVLESLGKGGSQLSPVAIGCAVTLAMFLAIQVAVTMGTLLPFLFRRLGIDPAIASGPLITTSNDIISVGIYLSIGVFMIHLFGQ
ncbi:MAG: magnesium transporter [Phycisphaerae bacterium]|nr:magnesium transporter [Phycisphaerae bacterium]